MKLNESTIEKVEKLYEGFQVKALDKEGIVSLLEGEGNPIPKEKLAPAIKMMQLQEMAINESNVSANIEPFVKKLQPLLRRVIPNIIAFDIAGVQPVESPDSSVYAIKSRYAGSKTTPISNTAKIVVYTGPTAVEKGDQITGENGAQGNVVYAESGKVVVEVTSGAFAAGEKFDVGDTYTADANDDTISAIYSSEASFKQILKDYSGPYTTAAGEALGDEMNQLKVTVEKMPVSVKTRALKAEFTMELVQDLRAMHGAVADEELMAFLETEITLDLDREIVAKYKEIATASPDFVVSTGSAGRWSMEMYAGLWQKILKSANGMVTKNRRGKGNILVATAGVISALESAGKFKLTGYESAVSTSSTPAQTFVGVLSNGMKVYQDLFAENEYAMVIYKGESQMDAGVIYSPYAPLSFVDAIDAKTLQPVIGCRTRYGVTVNTLLDDEAGSNYAEIFNVDFSSTPLA